MMHVDDEKMIDIETKLSHQEDLLATLNEALSNQQVQIASLENLCRSLVDRIRALSDGGSDGEQQDEQPPHF